MTTRPNLEQLRKQARELLKALAEGEPTASGRLRAVHPKYSRSAADLLQPRKPVLADAQLVLAREHRFPSWPRFKRFVDDLDDVDREAEALLSKWSRGDPNTREKVRQAKEPYFRSDRFENPDPDGELTSHDAHVIGAMDRGYARWDKFESFLHLDPNVRDVIAAIKVGDLDRVREILDEDLAAAEPHWVGEYSHSNPNLKREKNRSNFEPGPDTVVANDSVPLFIVSEAFFNGSNKKGNEYELAKALLDAGADPMIEGHLPMTSACSFNAMGTVRALLEAGAEIDGPGGHGINLCYALYFGFTELSEFLAAQGAKLDLRFAAGLGRLDTVRSFFRPDGSLKSGAGDLADPYRTESDRPHNTARTRELIVQQALMFACLHGRLEVIAYLIERGADPSALVIGTDIDATAMHKLAALGSYGETADIREIEARRLPAVRLLLEQGYDLEVRDAQHDATALDWAQHCGAEEIAALLRVDA